MSARSQRRRKLWNGPWAVLCLSGTVAVIFGLWAKHFQLTAVSPVLPSFYPFGYWLSAPVALFFLLSTLSLLTGVFCKWILRLDSPWRWATSDALSGTGLLLVPLGASLALGLWVTLCIKLVAWGWAIAKAPPEVQRRIREHGFAFIVFALAHFAFAPTSPLSWRNPIVSFSSLENDQLGSNSPLHRENFVNAKALDFSNFSWDYWGANPHAPVQAYSYATSFLTLLLNPPVTDPAWFFRIAQILFYLWFLFGCFGFYLFAREGLGFSFPVAILGGLYYFFSNTHFLLVLYRNIPLAAGAYLQLPWTLWLLKLAREKAVPSLAFAAGLTLAVSLAVLPPHPEPLLLACGFAFAYACLLSANQPGIRGKLANPLLLTLGVVLGSLVVMLPVLISLFSLESKIIGHRNAVFSLDSSELVIRWITSFYNCSLLSLLALFLLSFKRVWEGARHRRELVFFLGTMAGVIVFSSFGNDNPILPVIRAVIPFLNLREIDRIGTFVSLSAVIVSLWGLEKWLSDGMVPWLDALCVTSLLRYFWWGHSSAVMPAAIFFLVWLGVTVLCLPWRAKTWPWLRAARLASWGTVPILTACFLWTQYLPNVHPLFPSPRPYLSFEAEVANFRNLRFLDAASLTHLRGRLKNFENKLRSATSEIAHRYDDYDQEVTRREIRGTRPVSIDEEGEFFASVAPLVDRYFLTEGGEREYPIAHMLKFNDAKVLQGIDGLSRVFSFSNDTEGHLGAWAEGFLLHNRNQTMDTRFSVGFPPLNALYLIPGMLYERMGDYDSISAWKISPNMISHPASRRIFNIAGVDAYLVNPKFWNNLRNRAELQLVGGHPDNRSSPLLIRDEHSYGMVYLASTVTKVAPLPDRLWKLTPPFTSEADAKEYRELIVRLLNQLLALDRKYAVVVEDPSLSALEPGRQLASTEVPSTPNELSIENLLGNKAIFKVNCKTSSCLMVLNMGALSGWRAFIDRESTPIQRANLAFIGVNVPQGLHAVWLEYRPPSAEMGLFLTLLAWFVGTLWLLHSSPLRLQRE